MPRIRNHNVVDEQEPGGGWVTVTADEHHLRVRTGTVGSRLDPSRRVPRTCWDVRRIGTEVELLATWPVSELVTHRIGEQVAQLRDDLARAGADPDVGIAAVADAVDRVLAGAPGSATDEREGLAPRLWAAAYPLLREPLSRGADLDRVPVALDAVLRASHPRRAAQLAFGRVTRPLVRSLAASLVPGPNGGAIPFEPALLALMASPWCGPEQLVAILGTAPHRPGAVAFDVGDVDRARAMFAGVPPRRVVRRLQAALTEPDGIRRFAEELAAWSPPAEAPAAPGPAPAPPTTVPAGALRPPPRTDVALHHPPAVAAVDGLEIGAHRVVLPRRADDLLAWGGALDNCLGGFRHAVADGRSHVLGLRSRDGRLRYAIEVTPGGVVRQFEGRGNRQAPDAVARPVLVALRARGVVSADGRRGRSLLAPR